MWADMARADKIGISIELGTCACDSTASFGVLMTDSDVASGVSGVAEDSLNLIS